VKTTRERKIKRAIDKLHLYYLLNASASASGYLNGDWKILDCMSCFYEDYRPCVNCDKYDIHIDLKNFDAYQMRKEGKKKPDGWYWITTCDRWKPNKV